MELLISLLFLLAAYGICLRFFTAAGVYSAESEQLNRAMILCQSAAETLKETDGDKALTAEILQGIREEDAITVYYNSSWEVCPKQECAYTLRARVNNTPSGLVEARITLSSSKENIFTLETACFPIKGEAQ